MNNKLEELSKNNKDNYQLYLQRMSDSVKHSTKGFIPMLASEANNILDVGCGSGVLMSALEYERPKAKITGLDLNIEAITKLREMHNNWHLIHDDFMNLDNQKYDTIIFSSILHEISSYNANLDKRFTEIPIKEAFLKSYDLLDDNGVIILRDGILTDDSKKNHKLVISFNEEKDSMWLYRFRNDFKGFSKTDINTNIYGLDSNKFLVSEGFLKEFLYTYTWGPESYPREINERFGILTKDTWLRLLKEAGFSIETVIEAKEEYEKYLKDKIIISEEDNSNYEYPNMTILVKARKKI